MSTRARLRASAICEAEGHLLLVRLRDPVTGFEALFPPGGGIEANEEPAESARRETLEETGLHVRVDPEVRLVETYPFRWAGVDYDVTTHYFAASLEGAFDLTLPKVTDAPYNLGAVWVPVSEALEAMRVYRSIASASAQVLRLSKHAAWQKHPNLQGPASTLLRVHHQFRLGSGRLAQLVEQSSPESLGRVARAFMPLAETLHHHHHAEEVMLFPLIERRTGAPPDRLVSNHEELMSAIALVEESLAGTDKERAKAAALTFDDVLVAHLDREESLVVPVLLEMTPDEAWGLIEGH